MKLSQMIKVQISSTKVLTIPPWIPAKSESVYSLGIILAVVIILVSHRNLV